MKNKISLAALATFVTTFFSTTAQATILNGGFESGFKNWDTIGEVDVLGSSVGINPLEGNSQAFLSTAFEEVIDIARNKGGNAVIASFISDFSNLEEFLGLSAFLGNPSLADISTAEPIEGSAIKQSFTAQAGQQLSFSYNFLTNENDNDDLAFVAIKSNSSNWMVKPLASIKTSSFRNLNNTFFAKETGFVTFNYTVPTTGNYTLGIGVIDVGDSEDVSGLLVDQIKAVPESSTTAAIGLFGAIAAISVFKPNKRKIHKENS